MGRVLLVPATAEDFQQLHGGLPPVRVRAFAGHHEDGALLGVGGIGLYPNGEHVAFVKLRPEAKDYPIALHKAALRTIAFAREQKISRLLALADDTDVAERWLLRLGFKKYSSEGEMVYELRLTDG